MYSNFIEIRLSSLNGNIIDITLAANYRLNVNGFDNHFPYEIISTKGLWFIKGFTTQACFLACLLEFEAGETSLPSP